MEPITINTQTILLIGYAISLTAWLVKLQMMVLSKVDKESMVRANGRIEALEKSVDGKGGLNDQMTEMIKLVNKINWNLKLLMQKLKVDEEDDHG